MAFTTSNRVQYLSVRLLFTFTDEEVVLLTADVATICMIKLTLNVAANKERIFPVNDFL